MIRIFKKILFLVLFIFSFNEIGAQSPKCLYDFFAQDLKNSEFEAFCSGHKDPLAHYEGLLNTGDLFNKLSGVNKVGLRTKVLSSLNTKQVPKLAASFKNLSPTRVVTVLNAISTKGLKKVIKDPNISEVWSLVLKEFPKIGVKEKNLETFLKLRSRGKAFFDDAIQLVKDSSVKQKLIDNLAKADEVFKSDIQNIKYTVVKSSGEVKIINKKRNDELIAIITNGKLEKKKFIDRGTKIGDKRRNLYQNGDDVGFGNYPQEIITLLWGNSKSSFNKIRKTLKKSGLLDEFKASYPSLTEFEIISVYKYTASSKNLNNPLNGVPGYALTDKLLAHKKVLDATLNKLKTRKAYINDVYRGANLDESLVISKYKNNVGKKITEDAYTSSSKLEKVADDFIKKFEAVDKVKVKFIIKSKTGIDVNEMSHFTKVNGDDQAEILFKSGTEFKVLFAKKDADGIYKIIMQEI